MTMHSFDTEIAEKHGVNEAIILHNIAHWIRKNQANKNEKSFHKGRYWTYNSIGAFSDLFPYFKAGTIRRALDKLEENGVVETGIYNEVAYDRTKWYSIGRHY